MQKAATSDSRSPRDLGDLRWQVVRQIYCHLPSWTVVAGEPLSARGSQLRLVLCLAFPMHGLCEEVM
jgi:hypothetical protein